MEELWAILLFSVVFAVVLTVGLAFSPPDSEPKSGSTWRPADKKSKDSGYYDSGGSSWSGGYDSDSGGGDGGE